MIRASLFLAALAACQPCFERTATAQSLQPISFQARITGVGNGPVELSFDVFETPAGGAPLNEDPIVVPGVQAVDGVVSVELPASPLWFPGATRYLEVAVDGEVLPQRIPIVGAPRALATRAIVDPNGDSWVFSSGNQLIWVYEPGFASFDAWSIAQANLTPGDLGFALRNGTQGQHPSGAESWMFVDQATGFVGIGVDEPEDNLHVWGNVLATLDLRCGDDVIANDLVGCGRVIAENDVTAGNDVVANQDVVAGDLVSGSRIFASSEMGLFNSFGDPILSFTENAINGPFMEFLDAEGRQFMRFNQSTSGGPFMEFTDPSGDPVFRLSSDGEGGGFIGLSKGGCSPQSALCPLVTLSTSVAGAGFIGLEGGCSQTFTVSNLDGHPSNGFLSVRGVDQQGVCNQSQGGIFIDDNGDAIVFGDVKAFRMTNPIDPETELWYAAPEGPEAATYLRGAGVLVNGAAEIVFPAHFAAVANPADMTVHLTPSSAESLGLACVRKDAAGFVVRELQNGQGSYPFDWYVMCTRAGFEGFEVVRPRGAARPAASSVPLGAMGPGR